MRVLLWNFYILLWLDLPSRLPFSYAGNWTARRLLVIRIFLLTSWGNAVQLLLGSMKELRWSSSAATNPQERNNMCFTLKRKPKAHYLRGDSGGRGCSFNVNFIIFVQYAIFNSGNYMINMNNKLVPTLTVILYFSCLIRHIKFKGFVVVGTIPMIGSRNKIWYICPNVHRKNWLPEAIDKYFVPWWNFLCSI